VIPLSTVMVTYPIVHATIAEMPIQSSTQMSPNGHITPNTHLMNLTMSLIP
jgi:hypothetical protein